MIDETRRLEILRRYAIVGTPAESVFERIVDMACMHFDMPIATVGFVDDRNQWFKAVRGLPDRHIPLETAICRYTIQSDEIMVVTDAAADVRFRDTPPVTHEPGLRFYAGAPLITPDGYRLGTVAVMDTKPHPDLTANQRSFLGWLAETVTHELEMRLAASTILAEMERRRQADTELRQLSERFRFAVTHSPVVLFTQDRKLRYTWVANTPTFLPSSTIIGRTDHELLPPADAARLTALKRMVLDDGVGVRHEVTVHLAGGSRSLDLTLEPLRDSGGAITGLSGAAIDITSNKARKEALRRAYAEAHHANQAKAKFLAAASHDLRQPFQAMRLFTHLLDQNLTDPTHRHLIEKLIEAMEAAEILLNSLLDISVLEAGLLSPQFKTFALHPWLHKLAGEYEPLAREKGVRLRMRCPQIWVRSDPLLLGRVIGNLLGNAVKYTQRGKILLGARMSGRCCRIEIWDTGPGIPAEEMEAIFEDFHQLGNVERDRRQGLGLGLGIARRMARLLGHHLNLRSWPGRGSVFTVTIQPASPEPEERPR